MNFAEKWVTAGWSRSPFGEWIELGGVAEVNLDPPPPRPEIGVHEIAALLNSLERPEEVSGHLVTSERRGTIVTFEDGQPHIHAHPTICASCRHFLPMAEINLSQCAVWYRQNLLTGEKKYHGPLCVDKNHGNCADFASLPFPKGGCYRPASRTHP